MRKVEFTKQTIYETEGRNKGPTYKVGQVEEMRDDIAERFVRRGVAVYVDGSAPARPSQPRLIVPARLETAGEVEIPGDWESMRAAELKEIAALLVAPAPATRNDALDAIRAELEARKA